MKPKAYIFAGLAIVCGLGASYMTSRLLAERQPEDAEKVEILVARRNLNVGERIVRPEEAFEMKSVLKENEPPDALKDYESVKGKIMKSTRNKGDHITVANLYDKDLLDIPEGFYAVGLPVNLATSVAGLASLPGSRVNLILTVREQNSRTSSSRVVLQNVLVLAADGRTTREGDPIAAASVVTFALSQKDALTVSLAKELGTLSLSLRKLNDPSSGPVDIVTGADVLAQKEKEPGVTAQATPHHVPTLPTETKQEVVKEQSKVVEEKDIRVLTIENGARELQYQYEVLPNGQIRGLSPDNETPAPLPSGPRPSNKREI